MQKYNISERTYYTLTRMEHNLESTEKENMLFYKNRKTFRKCKNDIVNDIMITWFQEMRDRGEPVNGTLLRQKALTFNKLINGPKSFKASNGWLGGFKDRYSISELRMSEENKNEAAEIFYKVVSQKIQHEDLNLHNVYNADESGIFWKNLKTSKLKANTNTNTKYNFESNKSNDRVTALFCSNAAGTNRIPLLIIGESESPECLSDNIVPEFKKKRFKALEKLRAIYTNQKKSQMDKDIFMLWYKDEFIPRVLEHQEMYGISGKVLLILDNAPCHPSLYELNAIHENFEVLFLPKNVTAFVQPMNQGLIEVTNKLYKKFLLENLLIHERLSQIDSYLENLNLQDCCILVSKAWNSLQENLLHEVWKPFLVDLFVPNFMECSKKIKNSELKVKEVQSFDDLTSFPFEMEHEIIKKLSKSNLKTDDLKQNLFDWFDLEENDCGWEPSSDIEIVNLVKNKNHEPEKYLGIKKKKKIEEVRVQADISDHVESFLENEEMEELTIKDEMSDPLETLAETEKMEDLEIKDEFSYFMKTLSKTGETEELRKKTENIDTFKNVVTSTEAYACLLKLKSWVQEQPQKLQYLTHVNAIQNLMLRSNDITMSTIPKEKECLML